MSDICDCPLGGRCKHAVALILTVMKQQALANTDHVAARPGAQGTAIRPAPDWRAALSGIDTEPHGDVPLALEFTMHTPMATRYAPAPTAQVLVRPMRMGARGKWVKTGATWPDVSSTYSWKVDGVIQGHLTAVRAMAAGNDEIRWSRSGGAVPLDRFGPGVWRALRQVVDAGVALITDRPGGSVTLADVPAEVQVDLKSADDGVALTATLIHDGRPLAGAPGSAHLVGRPPTGVVVTNGADIGLVPLAKPVHETLVPLLDGRALHVPDGDVDEFLEVYQPRLALVATIGSSDGSVTIEDTEFDGVVALIQHQSVDEASLSWVARYRRGERRTDHPLLSPLGVGRDRDAEHAVLAGIELPIELLPGLVDVAGRPKDLKVAGVDTVILFAQVVPWLIERDQVSVEVSGDAPRLRQATDDPLIELDVQDGEERRQRLVRPVGAGLASTASPSSSPVCSPPSAATSATWCSTAASGSTWTGPSWTASASSSTRPGTWPSTTRTAPSGSTASRAPGGTS